MLSSLFFTSFLQISYNAVNGQIYETMTDSPFTKKRSVFVKTYSKVRPLQTFRPHFPPSKNTGNSLPGIQSSTAKYINLYTKICILFFFVFLEEEKYTTLMRMW